jgi:hypothetical protein
VALVGLGAANVGDRRRDRGRLAAGVRERLVRRLGAGERLLRVARLDVLEADAGETDARAPDRAVRQRQRDRDTDRRPVTDLAFELQVGAARSRRRLGTRSRSAARRRGARRERVDEELPIGTTRSPRVLRSTTDAPIASIVEPRSPAGVGVAQRAADAAEVADQRSAHLRRGRRDRRAAACVITPDAARLLWRTSAPTCSSPSRSSIPSSPGSG